MADIKKFLDQAGVGTLWKRVAEELDKKATVVALNEVKGTADKAAEDITKLSTYVGTIPNGENGEAIAASVVEYVNKKTEGIATDAALGELQGKVTKNTEDIGKNAENIGKNAAAIALLNDAATVEGSVAHTVATEIAAIVAGADADFDTLKEIADWITNDATGAAGMANDIQALENKLAGVDKTVVDTIATKIDEALKLEGGANKYALASELTTLAGRVDALEAALGEGGSVATQITNAIAGLDADITSAAVEAGKGLQVQVVEVDGKITNVNVTGNYDNAYDAKGAAATAESNAKAYVDGKDSAMDARVKVLEAIKHDFDAAGSAAQALVDAKAYSDANLVTAKAYTDEAYNAIQALTANEIDAAIAAAKAEMGE